VVDAETAIRIIAARVPELTADEFETIAAALQGNRVPIDVPELTLEAIDALSDRVEALQSSIGSSNGVDRPPQADASERLSPRLGRKMILERALNWD
jgi:hypothetical protein